MEDLKQETSHYFDDDDYRQQEDLERAIGVLISVYKLFGFESGKVSTPYGLLDNEEVDEIKQLVDQYLE